MYEILKENFKKSFNKNAKWIFSAPGRTELGGNHTDHQRGCVLAAAVNLDTKAAVAPNGENIIRVLSEGYPICEVKLPVGNPSEKDFGTTKSLIEGVIARFQQLGSPINGFDAYVMSDVLPGSGLSSSAAFEVLIGVILNEMNGCGLSPAAIAMVGQYAENVYFGKPCGLMDQMASSVGNIITIDFKDPENPVIKPLSFDFTKSGYSLCIIDSGANHADLTDCYAAITEELRTVCKCFGKRVLREIPENKFYENINEVRKQCGDRAVLRAIHVYQDNKRVEREVKALEENNFAEFLKISEESGNSSWQLLQNVIPEGRTTAQEVAFAITLAKQFLGGKGAVRVHGGGFAGTVQAFVPNDMLDKFKSQIENALGEGSCHILSIRHDGGILAEVC